MRLLLDVDRLLRGEHSDPRALAAPRLPISAGPSGLRVVSIEIGEDVQIGPNVQLLTPTHPLEPEPRRAKVEAAKP